MKRYTTILNGGSLAGALAFALFLIFYKLMAVNPFGGIKFIGLVIPAGLMYLSMKKYKEIEGEGFLTYGKGFLSGILFTFVYSSLSAMLIYLFGYTVDAGFVEFFITDNLQTLGEGKEQLIKFLGEDTYKEMLNEMKSISLEDLAWSDFQSKTIGGFIIALIVAAILKQKPPIFTESEE
ncbi:MAG: DUF4199 domain-containing protein [Salibacteraceae bacterium]